MPGTLFIVATPIGNLSDMTLRAIDTLENADAILAEDTRVTAKLLAHFKIERPLVSFHEHTKDDKVVKIIERLTAGENLALVTDAGTPGLSDPGNVLVEAALTASISVVPIPGANALGTLISVAGIDMREFVFLGFPPHKKGRQTYFREVAECERPVVYYESPHRVVKNLELLLEMAPEKRLIVGRELTKMYEEIMRGSVSEVLEALKQKPAIKGEFTVIVYPVTHKRHSEESEHGMGE